jgi:hypothetical protein
VNKEQYFNRIFEIILKKYRFSSLFSIRVYTVSCGEAYSRISGEKQRPFWAWFPRVRITSSDYSFFVSSRMMSRISLFRPGSPVFAPQQSKKPLAFPKKELKPGVLMGEPGLIAEYPDGIRPFRGFRTGGGNYIFYRFKNEPCGSKPDQ